MKMALWSGGVLEGGEGCPLFRGVMERTQAPWGLTDNCFQERAVLLNTIAARTQQEWLGIYQ